MPLNLSRFNTDYESHASELMVEDYRWRTCRVYRVSFRKMREPPSQNRKTQTTSPTPHYPLLGIFRLATPWQCQMSPRQGEENCYLNLSSWAGVSSRASHHSLLSKHTMQHLGAHGI